MTTVLQFNLDAVTLLDTPHDPDRDTLCFGYRDAVVTAKKRLEGFVPVIDVSVDGFSVVYNADVSDEDVEAWINIERKLDSLRDANSARKRQAALAKIRWGK